MSELRESVAVKLGFKCFLLHKAPRSVIWTGGPLLGLILNTNMSRLTQSCDPRDPRICKHLTKRRNPVLTPVLNLLLSFSLHRFYAKCLGYAFRWDNIIKCRYQA